MRWPNAGLVRAVAGALLAAAGGCGYSPNPPSMKLRCATDMSCPEGYTCVADTCWRPAEANLPGHWVFGANSVQNVACDDGSTQMTQLQGPAGFIDLLPGPGPASAALTTHYFCEWNLDIAGSSTVIQANQSCSAPDMVNPTTQYTWHGESLAVTSGDGKKGKLAASFPYDYVTPTGRGKCTLHVTADLTKQ